MTTARRTTNPNHKARYLFAVKCACSCGWESVHWYGKGAKFYATTEWNMHREKCEAIDAQKTE